MDYRSAGVDVEAGRDFVERIRSTVEGTFRPGVLGGLGGFGGCFEIPPGYRRPVLVSGTDGVGTKLKIAQALNQHHSIGTDLVAMCVNDILTSGAEPLFFLDYLATGQLNPCQLSQVVEGVATGCLEAGCALLGGETAEMPGFYGVGEYDLAGFAVGIVEKEQLLDGSQVAVGDQAIALASSGVHSNGYSLVRKIVAEVQLTWQDLAPFAEGLNLGEAFLIPTRIYVTLILSLLRSGIPVHSLAHITGGGLPENLPRCLGPQQAIAVDAASWQIPPVFHWLAKQGQLSTTTLLETFNLGVGFVVVVPPEAVTPCLDFCGGQGTKAWLLGEVVAGNGEFLLRGDLPIDF
jgi:phosphoribosylformylglycinamidine cyclo-ligase